VNDVLKFTVGASDSTMSMSMFMCIIGYFCTV